MTDDKPFSPACDRNREPILAVLREHFRDRRNVLEIGSGTGQHAVHFAAAMPWLTWQCSDVADNLAGIRSWLEDAALPNTPAPIALDVANGPSFDRLRTHSDLPFDAVFSANTLHIMGWAEVEAFLAGVDRVLKSAPHPPSAPSSRAREEGTAGTLVVYGPFNYDGACTSDSNREFDGWLKARDPRSGIRDFEAVDALACAIGLRLVDDIAMPANNRCIVWRRGD
jgi:SAM-dependent methyltransferase